MSEWQDISTAPKDGTVVDLWVNNPALIARGQRVTDAFWIEGRWLELYQGEFDDADIFIAGIGPCDEVETPICKATHWMPLPTPPGESA